MVKAAVSKTKYNIPHWGKSAGNIRIEDSRRVSVQETAYAKVSNV